MLRVRLAENLRNSLVARSGSPEFLTRRAVESLSYWFFVKLRG